MSAANIPGGARDLAALVRHAVATTTPRADRGASTTSDLTMDEELNLHAIGWEPVELVSGYSAFSTPAGLWSWGQGEIATATEAHAHAFANAINRIHHDAAAVGAHGVVGVAIERSVHPSHTEVSLLGTAVRPAGAGALGADQVFVSDLSARDFSRLMLAGWEPRGLATGASFVYAPRRTVGMALAQQSQNVELTNYTEAMYSARELAMERMQESALSMKGAGVVEVKIVEGPMSFAPHAIGFAAWGTVVRLSEESHRLMSPTMVVSLNDPVVMFDAVTLE
ncbi:MAG TPA: heavy metal-binding domain-containing protein [Acidimicrobiales bacterium]|nr:heavy metal-binding domain-containing protein [Acidimicrobiales bacterium]